MKECTVSDFYVYLLYDTRNKEIFYVGKGKRNDSLATLKTRKRGTSQARYLNHTDIMKTKK